MLSSFVGNYYGVTVGHVIDEGMTCYVGRTNDELGTCVLRLQSPEAESLQSTEKVSYDISLIEIAKNREISINNTINSSQGERCGFTLPETLQEVCDMECWKIQRKSRNNWQYGYLRYAIFTNKDWEIYNNIAVLRTAEESPPVLIPGDCGSLLTSLPRRGNENIGNKLTVYGMFTGCLYQDAVDGAEEEVEMFIAFPFKHALEKILEDPMFRGKTLDIVNLNLTEVVSHSLTIITSGVDGNG